MPDIRHRVGISAPVREVYDAFATRDGLAGWWTRDVAGESLPGGRLAFSFGGPEPAADMSVDEVESPRRVHWTCVEGPDEWRDTTVTFDVKEVDGETAVVFTHAGWREPTEFMHHCSTKWGYFLLQVKAGFEGGTASPWPRDMLISRWG